MSKFIFVTGGVLSGLGKGVAAASIGNLLKARGYSVFVLKLDPYLNVDPGVLSPNEHGEVYVTTDGGETDLDLGHYERFIDENFSKDSNYTSGKILANLLDKERKGLFEGKTVQYVPHVTDEIIKIIKNIEKKYQKDFVIVEIGGTVGDIESNPFIFAIAQMGHENFGKNVFYVHTTYVPFLETSKDFKTKPTQQSISILKSFGIKPNMILLRANKSSVASIVTKVANATFTDEKNIIPAPDLKNVFKMPLHLEKYKVSSQILNHFEMKVKPINLELWKSFVKIVESPKTDKVKILLVGKYANYSESYKSIIEALKISAHYLKYNLNIVYRDASEFNFEDEKSIDEEFEKEKYNGVIILPGFGKRGFETKVNMAIYTRKNNIPTFGICLGMQAMTVAQARLKGYPFATSKEFANLNDKREVYVLDYIEGKNASDNIGGTLRLGESKTIFKKDSLIAKYYESDFIFERHRHRYEVNKEFVSLLEDQDFSFSGFHPELNLVESCEDKSKTFYLGVQYHPEFTARPLKPHKLFTAFLEKSVKYNKKEK